MRALQISNYLVVVVGLLVCIHSSAVCAGPSFRGVGDLPGGDFAPTSDAIGISGDGRTVVGRSESSSGYEGFYWTQSGGIVGLGDLPGLAHNSVAWSASYDGSVLVGSGAVDEGNEAVRWLKSGGMTGLGDLPGGLHASQAYAVAHDGSIVVGGGHSDSGYEAFLWTAQGGMTGLGDLPGGSFYSCAADVSGDGTVVVGEGRSAGGGEAFRWTAGEGMVGIGRLPGEGMVSSAKAVSADGSTIVGLSYSTSTQTGDAFRWTAQEGMMGLGHLPGGDEARALGVSANGAIVVGGERVGLYTTAFMWDAEHGMRTLRDVLVDDYGLDLTEWRLLWAAAISDDGRTIVGQGVNPQGYSEGWVATIPEPTAGWLLLLGGAILLRGRAIGRGWFRSRACQ
ncbi:MAG TPA: PEP-CTERM sorting domain-containing protein [Phycisphaerae bacterium]|nr:PEP-CTERM sorting domain-containing protein [Phycisphaerae bacterium]